MGIPALLSLQFVAGRRVQGDSLAALTTQGIVDHTWTPIFWFLTLLCGFMVLAPSQITAFDAFCRRWTDVIWSASQRPGTSGRGEGQVRVLLAHGCLWNLRSNNVDPSSRPHHAREGSGNPLELCPGLHRHPHLYRQLHPPPQGVAARLVHAALSDRRHCVFFIGIACVATTAVLRDLGVLSR